MKREVGDFLLLVTNYTDTKTCRNVFDVNPEPDFSLFFCVNKPIKHISVSHTLTVHWVTFLPRETCGAIFFQIAASKKFYSL